ncbi:hypothetical protein ACFORL_09700 [Legionella dresdenensis]|uniref:Dot/Icm T4SS effector n=1 Tax=Legionella dresdenensis TaxID=450200 RepID=A0ABV8CG88_9GAMM
MPRFLMFDHGGVLDGSIVEDKNTITANDLILEEYDWGGAQVLKNGVGIFSTINNLIEYHDYEVVFHSKNDEKDQIKILEQLQQACKNKGLKFPIIRAMAVYDPSLYNNIPSSAPTIAVNQYGIYIANWGADDLNGKASVRRALENLLEINTKDRMNHIVFDDGEPNVTTPIQEGYRAFLIGSGDNCLPLDMALQQVLVKHIQEHNDSAGTISDLKLAKIKALCAQYLGHVQDVRQGDSAPYSAEDLKNKEAVFCQLYHAKNIQEAKTIWLANQGILNKNRTPWSILIIKAIAVILTLPVSLPALLIYSGVKRGTCNFFKPDSQIASDKIAVEFSKKQDNN